MDKKHWLLIQGFTGLVLFTTLLAALCLFSGREPPPASGFHFVILVPEQNRQQVQETVDSLESAYGLRLELHSFPSAAEQERLLRVLPEAEVDGVLLWPVSANDADYTEEVRALLDAGIPLVVVDRDIQQFRRSSYIGSGYKSDLLVLTQSLQSLRRRERFAVGSRFGSDKGQVAELLFFQLDGTGDLPTLPRDAKLQQLAQNPPEGYRPVDCRRVEGTNALQLKELLMDCFSGPQAPDLFFSLEPVLSSAAASAKRDRACGVHLLCYGERSQILPYLESGVVDGLVTTLPEVSVTIGVRYLRDICRGFWVPSSIDSGTTLVTAKEQEGGVTLMSQDE